MKENCKYNEQHKPSVKFPAKVFGYLGMCRDFKKVMALVAIKATPVSSNLPFVSSVTRKISPLGATKTHWSFLKY